MGSQSSDVNALVRFLFDLAAQRASGQVQVGQRTLVLWAGDLAAILPGPEDEPYESFLVRSGRLDERQLHEYEAAARAEGASLDAIIARESGIRAEALETMRRSLWLDRFVRALGEHDAQGPMPALEPARDAPARKLSVRLVPFVLDALVRTASGHPATEVGSRLNHRIHWNDDLHTPVIKAWAGFGDAPAKPAVATVLARKPAAAPAVAALMMAGAIRLDPPGSTYPPPPPTRKTGTLPPPPPRPSAIPGAAPVPPEARADPLAALIAARPPRTGFYPGSPDGTAEPLTATALPSFPPAAVRLEDPIAELERRIASLEGDDAPGAERARLFVSMAELWLSRLGSIEEATRCYREAAAADPNDGRLHELAAIHCHRSGRHELALQYCSAGVAAARISIERGSALKLAAHIHRHRDDVASAVEALCEAAADDPSDGRPHELVAGLLAERGDALGANAHARLAAAAHQDSSPERAQALLSWGFSLCPADLATAYEYASALDLAGHREAAITVLAVAAHRQPDPDSKRRIRLAAAQRAEDLDRHDLAVEQLATAFDQEPHVDLLYGLLEQDLNALRTPHDQAVLLDDIATACPPEQRGHWLTRAGLTMLRIPDQRDAAAWLLYEAVLTDPRANHALEGLRASAETPRQLALLAHALRASIASRLPGDFAGARPLLEELGRLSESRLKNLDLALAAWSQIERLGGEDPTVAAHLERLQPQVQGRERKLKRAEEALAQASASERAKACLDVANALPDLPETWARLIELLSVARDEGPEVDDRLETLYGLSRDPGALARLLEERVERAEDDADRARALGRLAAIHAVREDTRAVARTCARWVECEPQSRLAIARLDRAAQRLGDPNLLAIALEGRVRVAEEPRELAHALTRLARHLDATGDTPEAVALATEALSADPAAAGAAQLLLERAHHLPPAHALEMLQSVEEVLGDSRQLLARIVDAAMKSAHTEAALEAMQRWTRLLPSDVHGHRRLMRLLHSMKDAEGLVAAADDALSHASCPEVVRDAQDHSALLVKLGHPADAARLFLRTLEEAGTIDAALTRQALGLAHLAGDATLVTLALERQLCGTEGERRRELLDKLAAHHMTQGDRVGEARALLRALAIDGTDSGLLARLRELFVGAGDGERLLAVLELSANGASSPEERAEHMLGLIAASAQVAEDPERVEYYIKALIAEQAQDEALIRRALGALYAIGSARWAHERCESIAEHCPAALGAKVYAWAAATAEQDAASTALEIAARGALRFPVEAHLLLLVERLSLALDDVETAMSTYDTLIDASIGPHGRRALLYRAGRWLERAGRFEEAMARYERAFELAPGAGVAFKAIQRLGQQHGLFEPLGRVLERLSDHLEEGEARIELLRDAARVRTEELGQPIEGFELLLRANDLSESFELDDELERTADALGRNTPAGKRARDLFVAQLRQRAEQLWDGSDKVRCLTRLARILTTHEHAPGEALELIDQAAAMYASEEIENAELLGVIERERDRARQALHDGTAGGSPPAPAPADAAPAATHREGAHSTHEGIAPPPVLDVAELERRAGGGDLDAMLELARIIGAEGERRSEAVDLCCQVLRAEPWRVAALRRLRDLEPSGESATGWIASDLLAAIDPSVPAPPPLKLGRGYWPADELSGVLPAALPEPITRLLSLLWDHARGIPRFRRSLGSFGLSERDRMSRMTFGPTAEAYTLAARTLGISEVAVYAALETDQVASVLPLHPPAIVTARDAAESADALTFWMARTLWLARPAHVLLTGLEPTSGRALVRAAAAAFGPSGAADASLAEKELAAELWQSVPSREQREVSHILATNGASVDYDELRLEVLASATVAGLLVSGQAGLALGTALGDAPSMAPDGVSTDADLALAIRQSASLQRVMRAAWAAPLLGMVERALAARD